MVNLPNLPSAVNLIRGMDSLAPGPALDNLVRTSNQAWGFADDAGNIADNAGFRVDNGVAKIGDMKVADFMKLSEKAKLDFLGSDVFSPEVRTRIQSANTKNFTKDYAKTLEAGRSGRLKAEAQLMNADGVTVKNTTKFNAFMGKFNTAMKLGAVLAAGWGLDTLIGLMLAGNGCFLYGPEGEEIRQSEGDCSCAGGVGNPNALACCNACVESGDVMMCPGDTWTGAESDRPVDYVCPLDEEVEVAGRARRMRANPTLSVSAAKAQKRASALAASSLSGRSIASAAPVARGITCSMCGCENAPEWKLCLVEKSLFDVIGDMLAAIGKQIIELADGSLDIIDSVFDAVVGPLKMILIIGAAVLAVGVVIAVVVVVVKIAKKKKARLSGGSTWAPSESSLIIY